MNPIQGNLGNRFSAIFIVHRIRKKKFTWAIIGFRSPCCLVSFLPVNLCQKENLINIKKKSRPYNRSAFFVQALMLSKILFSVALGRMACSAFSSSGR